MAKSTLAAAMQTAAGKSPVIETATTALPSISAPVKTVMIGAHFPREVRRVLKLLEADTGKDLKRLLGEAINDLAAKHGKPQPYHDHV